ncbi:uncharacterized protein LOC132953596 [Metopolophium dirhodum]|uniref:uncharacterized protein LOC132953596 n=1 Tax=Metopolophium dirhodum TaxID=44670 RepID=UPI00298FB38B|nr:uncharacterized protein LOC132953596 [Metopolophium dirhodum]
MVNRVTIKPPPFWKGDPPIWFAQIEAQFALSGITNDTTKYFHLVTSGRYHSNSKEKKLRKLLSDVELGDGKPSVLLNEMQRLGGSALSADLLKSLWLQHLPITTQACLAVTKGSVDELARLADQVAEIGQPRSVAAVASDRTTELLQTLLKEVAELKLERQSRGDRACQPRSKSRSKSRSRYRQWEQPKDDLCFYHTNFKMKAKQCVEPCKHYTTFNLEN